VDELKAPGKPFDISKRAVWEAYVKVKANKGAPGVDAVSIEDFEKDLKGNLYKIWNRMSSGTYFPPPVRAVEIPKPGGTRIVGVPTVGDRIAQTVVARVLEAKAEPGFHPDSHGYRPGRSAIDAVGQCRRRCWRAGAARPGSACSHRRGDRRCPRTPSPGGSAVRLVVRRAGRRRSQQPCAGGRQRRVAAALLVAARSRRDRATRAGSDAAQPGIREVAARRARTTSLAVGCDPDRCHQ